MDEMTNAEHSTLHFLLNALVQSPSAAQELIKYLLKESPAPSRALRESVEGVRDGFEAAFATELSRADELAALRKIGNQLLEATSHFHKIAGRALLVQLSAV